MAKPLDVVETPLTGPAADRTHRTCRSQGGHGASLHFRRLPLVRSVIGRSNSLRVKSCTFV
ncbi:hypothetical protein I6G55_22645 [Burkholderia oklahomensis]|nr:hypothetical protein [Burkholderia oklahomensis]